MNRGLLAALRQVERIARESTLYKGDRARARALALVFEDCLDGTFLFTTRSQFLADLDAEQRDPFKARARDVAALASVVLDRVSFDEKSPDEELLPRAWFLDLGRLFEDVVTRELRRLVMPTRHVEEGSRALKPMFGAVNDRYRADPDLILKSGDRVDLIGDVKHKVWTGVADQDDLYQLLAHTATYQAQDCFLIYPHVRYEEVDLGRNPLGGTTFLFAVDVKDVRGTLGTALGRLKLWPIAA